MKIDWNSTHDERRRECFSRAEENRILIRSKFQFLSDVPAEIEWFPNLDNKNTR